MQKKLKLQLPPPPNLYSFTAKTVQIKVMQRRLGTVTVQRGR